MLYGVLLACPLGSASAAADRPNIIFLMSDDHAAHAVGAPQELHNLYGQRSHDAITAESKAELARLKPSLGDTDQFTAQQLPNGVDGPVAKLRGK
jgi:hypothetical protein